MKKVIFLLVLIIFIGCSSDDDALLELKPEIEDIAVVEDLGEVVIPKTSLKILSLGDSYTYGTFVCVECSFPKQLKVELLSELGRDYQIELEILARSGWTTSSLIDKIENTELATDYDLVTLLIGVNNQYRESAFSVYEREFSELVDKAVALAGGTKGNVIVLSIPDYAFTPFGDQEVKISNEIDAYNNFAESYCSDRRIVFLNITDITRLGIVSPELVALDGLHPSELAYKEFVERLLPLALDILKY